MQADSCMFVKFFASFLLQSMSQSKPFIIQNCACTKTLNLYVSYFVRFTLMSYSRTFFAELSSNGKKLTILTLFCGRHKITLAL